MYPNVTPIDTCHPIAMCARPAVQSLCHRNDPVDIYDYIWHNTFTQTHAQKPLNVRKMSRGWFHVAEISLLCWRLTITPYDFFILLHTHALGKPGKMWLYSYGSNYFLEHDLLKQSFVSVAHWTTNGELGKAIQIVLSGTTPTGETHALKYSYSGKQEIPSLKLT